MIPVLSIVIATKNRVSYCINTIETILKLPDADFELVVQDNTDALELKEYIESNIFDERLVYNYTPPPFSSIDNFNEVVGLAKGEYICMIGDDDGINPELINIARYAKKHSLDSIGASVIAEYVWPDAIGNNKTGYLSIPEFSGQISTYDPSKRLLPILLSGIINYIPFNLPRVYHGLIKKEVLESIKFKTGNYFGGLSPDIYSSIALSVLIKKHTLIDYPMTIAGTCIESTAAASVNGKHCGKIEEAPHLRNRNNYEWEQEVPKFYSIQTIWAETAIKALKDFDQRDLLRYFNFKMHVAKSLLYNPRIKALIIDEVKKTLSYKSKSVHLFFVQVYFVIFILKARKYILQFYKKIKPKSSISIFNDIKNIQQATMLLENEIKKNEFTIDQLN